MAIRLNKLSRRPSNPDEFDARKLCDWADWRRIYRQLLSEDRIWDFRDAFVAVCTSYGMKNALGAFCDYSSPIEGLLLDWQTDSHDESTELALLDLLSFMALATETSPDVGHLTETCLHFAEPIGNALLENSPHNIHSRPFVQWVIAKSVVGSAIGNFKYLADYRGHTVLPEFEPGMPYYVPVHRENPGWLPLDLVPPARQSLEMALKTSRELHDYRTEARCLQELSLRTQDPRRLLQELAKLQKSTQHDMDGYLATCLTRYLTCASSETKSVLLEDVKSFGSLEEPSNLVNPTGAAARDVLGRALSPNSADDFGKSIQAALKYYSYLPKSFQRTIESNVPRGPPAINGGEELPAQFSADDRSDEEKCFKKAQNAKKQNVDEVEIVRGDIKSGGKSEDYAPQLRQDTDQKPSTQTQDLKVLREDSSPVERQHLDFTDRFDGPRKPPIAHRRNSV